MAIEKKPRINLGDTKPTAQLAAATKVDEETKYFTAKVPVSVIQKFDLAAAREGERKGYVFFQKVLAEYLAKHHPDLLDKN